MTGLFVTFEGLDGSGKSTQLRPPPAGWSAAASRWCTHEPGGTPLGDAVRGIFLDPRWGAVDGTVELLLVSASRRQHLPEVIDPALRAGPGCSATASPTRPAPTGLRPRRPARPDRARRRARDRRPPSRPHPALRPARRRRGRRGQSPSRQRRGDVDRLDAEDLAFYSRVREGFLARAAASRSASASSTPRASRSDRLPACARRSRPRAEPGAGGDRPRGRAGAARGRAPLPGGDPPRRQPAAPARRR